MRHDMGTETGTEPLTAAGKKLMPWLSAHFFNSGGVLPAEAWDKAAAAVLAIEAEAAGSSTPLDDGPLREYLAANMFDGDGESGVTTMPVKGLLDTVVELVGEWRSAVPAPLDDGGLDELRAALAEWDAIEGSDLADQFRAFIAAGKMADAIRRALAETLRNRE